MNTFDRWMEWFLTWFDRAMDFVTLGWWSRDQGQYRIFIHFAIYKDDDKEGERHDGQ
jgi:hypothetical protein